MNHIPIKSNVVPLATVISERKFFMPRHQRPYDWKPDNVKAFLDDLLLAMEKKRSHHFLGTIMLVPHPDNKYAVSDGQQRITTFLLICANLCKMFHEAGDSGGVEKTLHMLFDISQFHNHTFEDAQKMRLRLRVEPLTHDRINFESLITGNLVRKNGKLVSASNAISQFFANKKFENKETRREFLNFLLNKIVVAVIDFENATDSINVFETQNTRGKSLEQIQLACTYFYLCLQGDEGASNRLYKQIDKVRTGLRGDEDKFFNYARYLALTRYGHLSTDRFCQDIKNHILDDADEVRALGKELAEDYRIGVFRVLARANRHDPYLENLAKISGLNRRQRTISNYVQDLRNLRSVSNAVLFALFCKHSETLENVSPKRKKEIAKFVCTSGKLLSSFFQRASHSFPGSFVPSRYDAGVAELAKRIANGDCKTTDDFLKSLKAMDEGGLIIPDAQYKERMKNISFPKSGQKGTIIARYLLSRINEHIARNQIDVPDEKNTIEHILPKSSAYAENWGFDSEEHGLYVHRLGNLTLLSPNDNKPDEATNAKFAKKQKLYARSSYQITKDLSELEEWSKGEIDKRQKNLAKFAALIWDFNT